MNSNNQIKPIKNKGPIRWEAITPAALFFGLIILYGRLFLDSNIKSLIELVGYHATGAEVNVQEVQTSFFQASIKIKGIQLTNPEKPTHNNLIIGEIRFSMLWDALLRAKIVINEATIENLSFDQKRNHVGKVKPPEPEKESALKKEAEKLKDQAIEKAKTDYQENVFGNIASLMSGSSGHDELKKLDAKLVSKEKMKAFEESLKLKQTEWETKLKKLPKASEFQALGDKMKKVKTSGFSKPEEVQASVAEIQKILTEAQAKVDEIKTTKDNFDSDLKNTDDTLKDIKKQIESDIKDLQSHFKIPKIDAKSLAMTIFKKYTDPYFVKINHYKSLFYKYAPPNMINKKGEPDVQIQPRPRVKGTDYEFGHANSYPAFWLKKAMISSHFSSNEQGSSSGDLKGQLLDVTSNQILIGKPTTLELSGDFPSEQISGLSLVGLFDNRGKDSLLSLDMKVESYPIAEKSLLESDDVKIGFKSAVGHAKAKLELVAYQNLTLNLENTFNKIDYDLSAKSNDIQSLLTRVFNDAKTTNLLAKGRGKLPSFDLDIESDLGRLLEAGINKEINAKVEELKKKVKDYVDAEINKQKEQLEKQVTALKSKIEDEIKKAQTQADAQKKMAEGKIDEAKKDIERRAEAEKNKLQAEANRRIDEEKRKAENETKKKAEQEAKKAADELKKKFGF